MLCANIGLREKSSHTSAVDSFSQHFAKRCQSLEGANVPAQPGYSDGPGANSEEHALASPTYASEPKSNPFVIKESFYSSDDKFIKDQLKDFVESIGMSVVDSGDPSAFSADLPDEPGSPNGAS